MTQTLRSSSLAGEPFINFQAYQPDSSAFPTNPLLKHPTPSDCSPSISAVSDIYKTPDLEHNQSNPQVIASKIFQEQALALNHDNIENSPNAPASSRRLQMGSQPLDRSIRQRVSPRIQVTMIKKDDAANVFKNSKAPGTSHQIPGPGYSCTLLTSTTSTTSSSTAASSSNAAVPAAEEERFAAAQRFLSDKYKDVTPATIQKIARAILFSQSGLQGDKAYEVKPTSEFKHTLLITKDKIYPLLKKIAFGTFSDVYSTEEIRLDNGANSSCLQPCNSLILKRARSVHRTYSPEKRNLDAAISTETSGVDRFLETFKGDDNRGYSIHEHYDSSLDKIEYDKLADPVFEMITVMTQIAEPLATMHKKNKIHGDIKPINMLIKTTNGIAKGALTDFGTLSTVQTRFHATTVTEIVADPRMFGDSPAESIFNQLRRRGIQTLEGDVYALGISITDILSKLIRHLIRNLDDVEKIDLEPEFKSIEAIATKVEYSTEKFRELAKTHGWCTVMRRTYGKRKEQIIYTYNSVDNLSADLDKLCGVAKKFISKEQYDALCGLAKLSCKMRAFEPYERPTMEEVYQHLANLVPPSQPIASQPIASQPIASQPLDSLPIASQPLDSLPIASQSIDSLPIASQSIDSQSSPSRKREREEKPTLNAAGLTD